MLNGGSGSSAVDRTPFFGFKVPQEVKSLCKSLQKVDTTVFQKLVQVAVEALQGNPPAYKQFKELTGKNLSEEHVTAMYSGVLTLLQMALRAPRASLKEDGFKQDLIELRIPENCIEEFTSVLFGSRRDALDAALMSTVPKLPKLQSFKWRVDVVISTSVLNRVLEPSIFMEMTLSTGEVQKFEVPMSSFHKMRYSVAQVLQEMEDLEKRNILKIQS